ncbi:hypothetical protein [Hoeflea prorocentri]|uniref:Uncharacterized protein n=1 Tax=Hoeflea prorocentri TaxID=1922333 RepID=A0A9X3ZJH7_9HYPH|nr:hypothetical protein [Hoeflea prorocentri]MCY6383113.1 hypothetical protein [Hoeflea prorocentri]MDA5400913.1 hypothetical protein [Hoeflea prorocentri]
MTEQKMMGRAIFSSFIIAGAVILAAAFLAPKAGMSSDNGCNAAYGIDNCAAVSTATNQ